jgi:hypothetical protein
MIPLQYHRLAEQIQRERISGAQTPPPEWPPRRARWVASRRLYPSRRAWLMKAAQWTTMLGPWRRWVSTLISLWTRSAPLGGPRGRYGDGRRLV